MENLIPALIVALVCALMIWLGLRNRKGAIKAYEEDKQRYTGTAAMTVVDLREEDVERWEEQEDGTSHLARYTVHLPTYEDTVDGKTYTYSSRQDWGSNKGVGRQVTGYYDPKNPGLIREDKPRKPLIGGGIFFVFAAFCLVVEILLIREMIIWGL